MKIFSIFLLVLFFVACQGEASQDMAEMSMAYQEEADLYEEDDQQPAAAQAFVAERKLIKTAEMRLRVEDLKRSTERIESLTAEFSGFISGLHQANNRYTINSNLTIRVPAKDLDQFLSALEKESIYTDYKRINAQDVTEEFVDISTRLETKKAVRDRYISILREKAQTVEDILAAEEKIRIIQEEIESIEGRLKYINNRTSLSTVSVDLYQEVAYVAPPPTHEKSFFNKLTDGFLNGWDLILNLAVVMVSIWPVLLILVVVFAFRKRIRIFGRK